MAREHEVSFIQACRRVFDQQHKDVARKLRLAAKSVDSDDLQDLFDPTTADAVLIAALTASYEASVAEAGQLASMLVSTQVYDNTSPSVVDYIKHRAAKVAGAINTETDKQLKASLAQGLHKGETLSELLVRVDEVFGAAAGYRSERIARTESIRSSTFASIDAWDKSGEVLAKEWFTAKDERVCKLCNSLDGRIIGLKANYFDQGDTYSVTDDETGKTQSIKLDFEDIEGPPLHVQCRCTLLPVLVQA